MDNYFDMYTPQVLSSVLDLVEKPSRWLTRQFLDGAETVLQATEEVMYDVVSNTYKMAPLQYNGDPAQYMDFKRKLETKVVSPAQIFLKQDITARDIQQIRMAGQSPIFTSDAAASDGMKAAFDEYVANKQADMLESVANRMEWMMAQIITAPGAITYTNPESNRSFAIDYGVPDGNTITSADKWDGDDADPIYQLKKWQQTYTKMNGFPATHFLVGEDAADAFFLNENVRDYFKFNTGSVRSMADITLEKREDDVYHVGWVKGAGDLWFYNGQYIDDQDDVEYDFLSSKYLYMFNPRAIKAHYGAVLDTNQENPIIRTKMYSKIYKPEDGKSWILSLESHPLIVLYHNTAVMKIQVVTT